MSNKLLQQENFPFFSDYAAVKQRRQIVDTLVATAAEENWLGLVEKTLKKLGICFDAQNAVSIEDDQLLPALGEVLDCPDELVRELGLSVLSELGEIAEPLLPKMLLLLDDPNREVRALAMLSVAGFGEKAKAAIPVLQRWIDSSDDLVRVMAMENIPRIDPSKLEPMLELLAVEAERKSKGQVTAIMALGGLRGSATASVPALKRLLNNESAGTRLIAAEAIHAITGDISDSIQVATELLDDPDWTVRYMAEEHLEQWQGRPRSETNRDQINIVKIQRRR